MNTPYDPAYPGKPVAKLIPNPKLRFLDQCREVLRFKQMALRTEEAYVDWIRRFIVWAKDHPVAEGHPHLTPPHPQPLSNPIGEGGVELSPPSEGAEREKEFPGSTESRPTGGWRHPRDMGAVEVRGFLTHLAAERNVAAATQNQASRWVESLRLRVEGQAAAKDLRSPLSMRLCFSAVW